MSTSTSKLTKKYQATIPEAVRKVLKLNAGDAIAFDVTGDEIHLRKAVPTDLAFAHAIGETLTEWNSDVDEEAFRDL